MADQQAFLKGVIKLDLKIGTITHYYDKIGVAIVEVVRQSLKVGDAVRISGHDQEFTQKVESLQVEHNQVVQVAAGETAGIKVDRPVKEGDELFLLAQK